MWERKNQTFNSLNVGDTVITIDNNIEYLSTITQIESNYIETTYTRSYNPEWVIYDTEKGNRCYKPQHVKNYFGPNGEINIKLVY